MKNNIDIKNIFNISLLLISLGILVYFCVSDGNLFTLLSSLPTLNFLWLFLAFVFMVFSWFLDSTLIHTIALSSYDGGYLRRNAFKITMVGQFFSSITPLSVGGQPMQILSMVRQGMGAGTAISILVRKFLVYQITLTIYSLTVIISKFYFFKETIPGFIPLSLIGFLSQAIIVVILILFSVNKKLTTAVINWLFCLLEKFKIVKNPEQTSKKVEEQLEFYLKNSKTINKDAKMQVKLYLLTFGQLSALFMIPCIIYKAFHNPGFPVVDMISAQAFVTMISSYTPLPGSSGTCEGSFLAIFNMFFDSDMIKQAMLLCRFITYYFCIIIGSFFADIGQKMRNLVIYLSY